MSVITDTWRQLVRRRLWPVAVLLLAALAAVPVVLAKEPAVPAPVPPPAAAPATDAGPGDPVVMLASTEDRAKRRRVLGGAKNPFEPAPRPKAKRQRRVVKRAASSAAPEKTPSRESVSTTVSVPNASSAPATTTPAAPQARPERPKHAANSLTVRFGEATREELERGDLERGDALETGEEPLIVFERLTDGGKTAVFLIDASVTADGDGDCEPRPSACQEVHLRAGETEFFDVTSADGASTQYQLDVVRIHT